MEDTSDMDLDRSYDRNVHSHNRATLAGDNTDQTTSTAADGSPMNWTQTNPTHTSILGQGEQPPTSWPTINQSNQIFPSTIHDNHNIPRYNGTTLHPTFILGQGAQPPTYTTNQPLAIQNNRRQRLPPRLDGEYLSRISTNTQGRFRHSFYKSHLFEKNRHPMASSGLGVPPPRDYRKRTDFSTFAFRYGPGAPAGKPAAKPSTSKQPTPKQMTVQQAMEAKLKKWHANNHARKVRAEQAAKSNRTSVTPVTPCKRSGDDMEDVEDAEFSARGFEDLPDMPESAVSSFSRSQSGAGLSLTKVKDRFRAIIRTIVRADEATQEIVYLPTGPHSYKRRAIARTLPGAYPLDDISFDDHVPTTEHDINQTDAAVSTNGTTTGPSESSTATGKVFKHVDSLISSSHESNNRSDTAPSNTNLASNDQMAQSSGSRSTPSLDSINHTPTSLKRKRAFSADSEEEDLVLHKPKKAKDAKKSAIKIKISGNPLLKNKKRAAKAATAADEEDYLILHKPKETDGSKKSQIKIKLTGKTVMGTDSSEPNSQKVNQHKRSRRDLDLPVMKTRFTKGPPQRKRIALSSSSAVLPVTNEKDGSETVPTRKVEKIMDLTNPDPTQNVTQVQVGNVSGNVDHSQSDFQTYRESEERPSTSSSGSSEGVEQEQSQLEQSDSPGDTQVIDRPQKYDHGHLGPANVKQSSKEQRKASRETAKESAVRASDRDWDSPIDVAQSLGLEEHTAITKCNLKDAKPAKPLKIKAKSLEELMKHATVDEAEDLQISNSRTDLREEESEKQRLAEAEVRRKAEQAEAEAKRRAEEEQRAAEAAKSERRRQLLSQGPTSAESSAITAALSSRNQMAELSRNFSVRDLRTLVPDTTWLNDSTVNKYLEELTRVACQKAGYQDADRKAGKAPPYQCLLSNWWVDVFQKGIDKVLSWNRRSRLHEGRLLLVKGLFIPICHGAHWRLVVVSGTERTIKYFDSLAGSPNPFVAKTLEWVKATLGPAYDDAEWRIVDGGDQRSPRQSNSDDCGVFTLQNARAVALGLDINPDLYVTSTEGILRVRHQMAAQLLSGELDWE
ncbi:hypothetical protein SLS55_001634 [Diplodia seriata]|uniref:Ubiquitin-like protease family profile domain-containing protein n=1 Tax=Diplodia seriata TaxID=420778 RepID=A0ABR3CPW0_9PEZI